MPALLLLSLIFLPFGAFASGQGASHGGDEKRDFTFVPKDSTVNMERIQANQTMKNILNSVAAQEQRNVIINSGFRSQEQQNAIRARRGCRRRGGTCGGAAGKSTHTGATAADITIPGKGPDEVYSRLVEARARFRMSNQYRVLRYCDSPHSHIDDGIGKEGTDRTPSACFSVGKSRGAGKKARHRRGRR